MTGVLQAAALLGAAAAAVAALAALVATRRPGVAVPVLLDLLLAVALLHLAADRSWTAVGTAAAVVVVRQAGLRSRRV